MGHWVAVHLNYYFAHWGYWTVLVGIMLESAGIPLPGETVLIVASTLAASKHQLNIFVVAVIAVAAATTGDNIGFAAGRYGGRPLLDQYGHLFHINAGVIEKGERLIERRGAMAVFFARFIAGLRFLAGPIAGVLRMPWRRFFLFNALGAMAWVTVITSLAYFFGPALESVLRHAGWAVLAALAAGVAAYFWWRRRNEADRPHERKAA
ncbi:MAG: DedA family protein [Actinomycetota bacterium]